jgi:hypothetical protein
MFDRLSTQLATALVTGLDVAVEFATLGEYRLAHELEGPQAALEAPRPLLTPRVFDGGAAEMATPVLVDRLPRPASRAAGAPLPETPAVMTVCASAQRRRSGAVAPAAAVTAPSRRSRSRGGAVTAAEQLCLWV